MTDELLEEEIEQLNRDGVGLPARIQEKLRRSLVTRRMPGKLNSAERSVSSPWSDRKRVRGSTRDESHDEEA
jgi:hypothetical protein